MKPILQFLLHEGGIWHYASELHNEWDELIARGTVNVNPFIGAEPRFIQIYAARILREEIRWYEDSGVQA